MREQTSPVVSLWRGFFVTGALRWLLQERHTTSCGRNLTCAPGRTVGEVVDKLKGDGCETACTGTRDTQCVYVPYVLSVSFEFLRAVARVCGVHVSLLRMWCSA